jgi:aspartyl protease family protein
MFGGLNEDEIIRFIYLSIILIALATGIFSGGLRKSKIAKYLLIWSGIAFLFIALYSFRFEFASLKNRVVAELVPSRAIKITDDQIAISASQNGHFYVKIKVNNVPISFMVDTGASDVALSFDDAKKANIDLDNLYGFRQYNTANGTITSALANADKMQIADVIFENVSVSVNENMKTSLLGMSFLRKFKKYEFYQDRLVLTY